MARHYFSFRAEASETEATTRFRSWPTLSNRLGALRNGTGLVVWKPVQLSWLAWPDGWLPLARLWHFLVMWAILFFIVGPFHYGDSAWLNNWCLCSRAGRESEYLPGSPAVTHIESDGMGSLPRRTISGETADPAAVRAALARRVQRREEAFLRIGKALQGRVYSAGLLCCAMKPTPKTQPRSDFSRLSRTSSVSRGSSLQHLADSVAVNERSCDGAGPIRRSWNRSGSVRRKTGLHAARFRRLARDSFRSSGAQRDSSEVGRRQSRCSPRNIAGLHTSRRPAVEHEESAEVLGISRAS